MACLAERTVNAQAQQWEQPCHGGLRCWGKRKPACVMENLACWQPRAGDLWQLYELKELRDSTASHQVLQLVDRPPLPSTSMPALLGVWWHVHLPDLVSLPTPDLSRQHPGCHQASIPGVGGPFQTSSQILQCPFPLSLSGKKMNGSQRLPISRVPALSTSLLSCLQGQSCPPPQRASTSAAA